MPADVAGASRGLEQLKAAVQKGDFGGAQTLLTKLKVALTEFTALPPTFEKTSTAAQELSIARDVFEQGVVLSVKQKDEGSFERNFQQLRPFYADLRHAMQPSPNEHLLTGLNLLRLLVNNRTAEFHVELELIPQEVHSNPHIKHAIDIEQFLMEGAYNKVLDARTRTPDPLYGAFMENLMKTVREEIGSCSEKAYKQLTLAEAQKLLKLDSAQQTAAFCQQRGWNVVDGVIRFKTVESEALTSKDIPAMPLISQTLAYARELERIV